MDLNYCIRRLRRGAETIRTLADGIGDDQARWRPAEGRWSILEVICHLADEEREDFRARIDIMLNHPDEPFAPIDPQGWVSSHRYNERQLRGALDEFLIARDRSIEWLSDLGDVDWSAAREHPAGGLLRAGDFMASWIAHDMLHVRQLAMLHHAWLEGRLAPFRTEYAG